MFSDTHHAKINSQRKRKRKASGSRSPPHAADGQPQQDLTARSDFRGLGLQYSGSGQFSIGRDLIVNGQDHQNPKRKPFSTVPFRPDPDFVDRPDLIAWVQKKCTEPAARAALVGLGGVGKSQVAIHYCHMIHKNSSPTWVFWVHSSTRARVEEAYMGIADRLELPGRSNPKANILQLVFNWLSDEQNGKWVMVLDNVDDGKVFFPDAGTQQQAGEEFTPLAAYIPQSSNGSVLLTSRDKDAALRLIGDLTNMREVKRMDEKLALELLHNKLQATPDLVDSTALVRTLECIPLAITQAAAYINQRASMTVKAYLEEFQKSDKKKTHLLCKDAGDLRRDASASHSLVTTWQISFERIREIRPSAANLLSLMSFFNPQQIPQWVLRSDSSAAASDCSSINSGDDSDHDPDFDDDVEVLKAFSLISETKNGMLEMHALVRLSTGLWLSKHGRPSHWEERFLALMCREFPTGEYENWAKCQELFPHIVQLCKLETANIPKTTWAKLMTNIAWYMWLKGNYNEAQIVATNALRAHQQQPVQDNRATLLCMGILAIILRTRGRYEEAEELSRRALKGYKEELGVRHPNTLTSLSDLASVLRDRGKYEEAEEMHRQALKGRQEELGDRHPDTLISKKKLGTVLQCQRKFEEAEGISRQALEGYRKELGDRHPDTLLSMGRLASVLRCRKKYEEAEIINRQALERYQNDLGDRHPFTLKSLDNLALILQECGRYEEAEEINRRALKGMQEELGDRHPNTLTSLNNLALILQHREEYGEAEEINRQVLDKRRQELGEQHPDTLKSVENLASVLQDRRKYEEAEEMYRKVWNGYKDKFGSAHDWTLTSMGNLVLVLQDQGKHEEAGQLSQASPMDKKS